MHFRSLGMFSTIRSILWLYASPAARKPWGQDLYRYRPYGVRKVVYGLSSSAIGTLW